MAYTYPPSGIGVLRQCMALQEYNTFGSQGAANTAAATPAHIDLFFAPETAFLAGMATNGALDEFGPYAKGIMFTGTPSPNFPATWYTYDVNNVKVASPFGPTIWIMNPTSTAAYTDSSGLAGTVGAVYNGFPSFHGHYLLNLINAHVQYTCVFADSLGTQSLNHQINPDTGIEETTTTWFAKLQTHMTTVQSIIHTAGFKVYPNGVITNANTYNYGDGGFLENFMRQPTDGAIANSTTLDTKFTTHGLRLINCQLAGKAALPQTELQGSPIDTNSTEIENWRRAIAAAYYILDRGLLYLDYNVNANPNTVHGLSFGQDLKTPMTTASTPQGYRLVTGTGGYLYGRRFLRGFALLNTASGALSYTLPRSDYLQLGGASQTAAITVPGRSGVLLTATIDDPAGGGGGPPPPTADYQDRIIALRGVPDTSATIRSIGTITNTESYTTGGQSFRAGFETGNLTEFSGANKAGQTSVAAGHAHTGTYALEVLVSSSGTSYAQQNVTPALSLYGRVWFSITALFNATAIIAQFVNTGGNNQVTLRTNSGGDISIGLGPKSGSATPIVTKVLYTLVPATDLGKYFRFEWFADYTNATTGFGHGWLLSTSGGLLGSTGVDNGNTTGTPLSFTGADYAQSTITSERVGILNSTPTSGTAWIDDVAYNATAIGRVGA